MKKDISSYFTKVMYLLFALGTIITMFIVHKNIENKAAIGFVIGYVIFIFLFLLYIAITVILNSRKLKGTEVAERVFKCIVSFILTWSLLYTFDCFFRPLKVNLPREFSIAFGVSFGIYFMDLVIFKKNKD